MTGMSKLFGESPLGDGILFFEYGCDIMNSTVNVNL